MLFKNMSTLRNMIKLKNDFCIKNKINIIRVPYFEFENMDFYLFDKFVELGIIEENKVS